MRIEDMNPACDTYRCDRDLDGEIRRRLLELNPDSRIRNGYYVLYDAVFNGDRIRLGKWHACDRDAASKGFRRAAEDPNASGVRLVLVDFR